ncbi:MAG TPA: FKBP-type peptidyl-prolyl cis-trans isomerase [bacterium]|nr:FKBP-type peptidyl-prolyl cis-trans isomerase [bacterium]
MKIRTTVAVAGLLFLLTACTSSNDTGNQGLNRQLVQDEQQQEQAETLTDPQANTTMPQLESSNTKEQTMDGATFLAENAKKEGVVVLDSGLQYKVLTAGTGPKPGATATVTTHYEGTLINGTVFDSSYRRGEPISFPVNGVIRGWQEALQLMPVGSTWMLYIPSELAYGSRGAPPSIGPDETLIFKVELIAINE